MKSPGFPVKFNLNLFLFHYLEVSFIVHRVGDESGVCSSTKFLSFDSFSKLVGDRFKPYVADTARLSY
jgi:hypothetical protein